MMSSAWLFEVCLSKCLVSELKKEEALVFSGSNGFGVFFVFVVPSKRVLELMTRAAAFDFFQTFLPIIIV